MSQPVPQYVAYSDSLESTSDAEAATHARIVDVMEQGMANVKQTHQLPQSVRISHAKAHALLTGELVVDNQLPSELAQGLFAQPGSHPVIVRLSAAPGEPTDDSKLRTVRGMSIKVFNVQGPHLPPWTSSTTQDFVLDTGKEFFNSNAESFLQTFKPNAKIAPSLSDSVKGAISQLSSGLNHALNAVGANSEKLDFFGHGSHHPMDEEYYSQTPLRYGQYVGKLGVVPSPDNGPLQLVKNKQYEPTTHDAFRHSCNDFFQQAGEHGVVFNVLVQLCTNTDTMPIEDAQAKWPEADSPYRHVATLLLPRQTAYDGSKDALVEQLSFSPAHSLEAHRPLGSVNRARLAAYNALAEKRRRENGWQLDEPSAPPAALQQLSTAAAAATVPITSAGAAPATTSVHTPTAGISQSATVQIA